MQCIHVQFVLFWIEEPPNYGNEWEVEKKLKKRKRKRKKENPTFFTLYLEIDILSI